MENTKEIKNEEVVEEVNETTEMVEVADEVTKEETKFQKLGKFAKKHGKKIVGATVTVVGVVAAACLLSKGKNSGDDDNYDNYDYDSSNAIDGEYSEVEE